MQKEPTVPFKYPEEEDNQERNAYREASKKMLRLLNMQADFILSSSSPLVATWASSYAIGLAVCEGVSITKRAELLGVSPQALSKQINQFRNAAGLGKSPYTYKS